MFHVCFSFYYYILFDTCQTFMPNIIDSYELLKNKPINQYAINI